METVFLHLLNMSITAGWLVLAVVVLRLLLRKAPRAITCALWGLVAVRLLFPVSIESVLSLIPSAETVPEDILYTELPTIDSGLPIVNDVVNPVLSETFAPAVGDSVNPMQVLAITATWLWVAGMTALLVYTAVSYLRLHRRTREGVEWERGVWLCDRIDTPFILGVFRPRIFLPTTMGVEDKRYVLAHEKAHLRRGDHLWKPLGFALLTVYWFNPLLWVAYILPGYRAGLRRKGNSGAGGGEQGGLFRRPHQLLCPPADGGGLPPGLRGGGHQESHPLGASLQKACLLGDSGSGGGQPGGGGVLSHQPGGERKDGSAKKWPADSQCGGGVRRRVLCGDQLPDDCRGAVYPGGMDQQK